MFLWKGFIAEVPCQCFVRIGLCVSYQCAIKFRFDGIRYLIEGSVSCAPDVRKTCTTSPMRLGELSLCDYDRLGVMTDPQCVCVYLVSERPSVDHNLECNSIIFCVQHTFSSLSDPRLLIMVFTAAQMTAFFEQAGQMAIPHATRE